MSRYSQPFVNQAVYSFAQLHGAIAPWVQSIVLRYANEFQFEAWLRSF